MKNSLICGLLFFALVLNSSGCYSLKGISIAPEVATFYVAPFTNAAPNAPANAALDFSELFKNKVRTETRLRFTDASPDVEFRGTLNGFRTTSEAPQPNELTAFNRLTVTYSVEYIDHSNEKNNWKNNFSFFANYANDQNLLDVQDALLAVINKQISEDIFNKAFSNW